MEKLLTVSDLRVHFYNAAPDRFAVDGISFDMAHGEILGLVGESGSGKTVTAMCVSGLMPPKSARITGSISLDNKEFVGASEALMSTYQGDEIAVVFQEPQTAMNPTRRIGPQVEEALRIHGNMTKQERKALALEALRQVELKDVEEVYRKYPHELSGGQLQRVMIAAAIIGKPQLLLADEPTTALDVTVQGQILELLRKLNREQGLAILFISHDLRVVRKLCSRVIVMQRGKIVERGPVEEIFASPKHEYTRQLIAAIPTRDRKLI